MGKVYRFICAAASYFAIAAFSVSAAADNRVVSAGAGITELVFALDAGNELVAVDSTSLLPEGETGIEKLGYHRMLSAEGILALNPSLVLGSNAMGPQATLDILASAKINVVQLKDAETQSQLLENINKMGELLQRQKQAEQLKTQLTDSFGKIAQKRQQIAAAGDTPKVLFLLLQADRPARVGGDDTAADKIIRLAGGVNAAGFDGYKTVSQEGIVALEPDVILVASRSEKAIEDAGETVFKNMPLLKLTPAGVNKQLGAIPAKALIGGLGLSAIDAANQLADELLATQRQQKD